MRRLLAFLAFVPTSLLLPGCPIYGGDHCEVSRDCAPGYACDFASGSCIPYDEPFGSYPSCSEPSDCTIGETCTPDGECRPGSCLFFGCVGGYDCSAARGVFECLPEDGDAGAPAAVDGGSTAPPTDDGSTASPDAATGGNDADAAPVGDGASVDAMSPVSDSAVSDGAAGSNGTPALDASASGDSGP